MNIKNLSFAALMSVSYTAIACDPQFDQGCEQQEPILIDCGMDMPCDGPIDEAPSQQNYYPLFTTASVDAGSSVTIDASTMYEGNADTMPGIEIATAPAQGSATINANGDLVYSTGEDFAALTEGNTATVTFTFYVTENGVAYTEESGTVDITVTGTTVVGQPPVPEEEVSEPITEELSAGNIIHDTLSRNGVLNNGELVTLWVNAPALAAGETLTLSAIPENLEFIEAFSSNLSGSDIPSGVIRSTVLTSSYNQDDHSVTFVAASDAATASVVAQAIFRATASESSSEESVIATATHLDAEQLENGSADIEIPPVMAKDAYLEIATMQNGAVFIAWPADNQESDIVQLSITAATEEGSLTCADTTMSGDGLLHGNGTPTASCEESSLSADIGDATLNEAPLSFPVNFTATETVSLAASASVTGSVTDYSLSASSSLANGLSVVPVITKPKGESSTVPLRLELPAGLTEASNLTVDLLLDPDSDNEFPASFDCEFIIVANAYKTSTMTTECSPEHLHIAFPVGVAVKNIESFSGGFATVYIDFDTGTLSDGIVTAHVLTVTKHDGIDEAVAQFNSYERTFEPDEESLGVLAAVLALLTFAYYRRRKQVA
ncbi:MAG: hypothetical protein VW274_02950 [Thalassolituus sp.]